MSGLALKTVGNSKMKPSARTEEQSERTIRRRGGAVVGEGVTAKTLATILGSYFSQPVADETGLKGLYDFELSWTGRADRLDADDEGGVSLISALRDQLGLKLTPKRLAVDCIAIDSATRAAAN